ncbi:MAG: type 1 periplasmic binding fold superfamily protein, partial [Bacteroidetes bacterium]|nr:type 1 periplasmic binding fold superfamily protein [Bacteroidota bacterium]
NLTAGETYNGTVQFLNETESPAENITTEVVEEADEHQVFYITGGGLDAAFNYNDTDSQGNPLGVTFTTVASNASSGTLNVTLRHEPMKPNDGTLSDAGGETDVSVTFDLEIQ